MDSILGCWMTKPYGGNKYLTYIPRLPESSNFKKHYYLDLRLSSIFKSGNSPIRGNLHAGHRHLQFRIIEILSRMGSWVRNEAQRFS